MPTLSGIFFRVTYLFGNLLCLARVLEDALEIGLDHAAEFGEVSEAALTVEERPAEFILEKFDCARQRGLRDIALLGRPGEIQLLGDGQEVSDLADLHCTLPLGGGSGCPGVAEQYY